MSSEEFQVSSLSMQRSVQDHRTGQSPDVVDIGRSFLFRGMCKRPFRRRLDDGRDLVLPCGKCLACRIRRRSVWTIRLLHENSAHAKSRFITLTYRDDTLPCRGNDSRGILVKSDLQNFFKRYRKNSRLPGLKYYACGEYGDDGDRPHYHAIVFGDAPTVQDLDEYWGLGRVSSDSVTGASISYVAGYVSKKLGLRDYNTQESRPAPFQISSQGLGLKWAQENVYEILSDAAVLRGTRHLPIPRSYITFFKDAFPDEAEGFSARQIFASDLALTDRILSVAPELGGRSWAQLDEVERDDVLFKLQEAGHTYDLHLRLRKNLFKEGKL